MSVLWTCDSYTGVCFHFRRQRKRATYGPESGSKHSLQMVKISCNFASNLCQKTGWDGNCLNILYNKSIHVLLLPTVANSLLVSFCPLQNLHEISFNNSYIQIQGSNFFTYEKKNDIFLHMVTLKANEATEGKL